MFGADDNNAILVLSRDDIDIPANCLNLLKDFIPIYIK